MIVLPFVDHGLFGTMITVAVDSNVVPRAHGRLEDCNDVFLMGLSILNTLFVGREGS